MHYYEIGTLYLREKLLWHAPAMVLVTQLLCSRLDVTHTVHAVKLVHK